MKKVEVKLEDVKVGDRVLITPPPFTAKESIEMYDGVVALVRGVRKDRITFTYETCNDGDFSPKDYPLFIKLQLKIGMEFRLNKDTKKHKIERVEDGE